MNSFANVIANFFTPNLTEALAWTLLHSVWQAAFIAFAVGAAQTLARKARPTTRYALYSSGLFATLLVVFCTFAGLYESGSGKASGGASENSHTNASAQALPRELQTPNATPATILQTDTKTPTALHAPTGEFVAALRVYSPFIALAWFLGASLFATRLLGGIVLAEQMKTRRTLPPAEHRWQAATDNFAERLGIRAKPRLLESGLADAPMTIGFFKPVILAPMGFFSGMPSALVEAIIAHEIAHIYRKDYIVGVAQRCVEIVLFFHPAVWWLSAQMRDEREHIADDLAADLCGNPRNLAAALALIEERNFASRFAARNAAFATDVSAAANDGKLLERVRRLLGKGSKRSFSLEYLTAFCALSGLFAFSLTASPAIKPIVKQMTAPIVSNIEHAADYAERLLAADLAENDARAADSDSTRKAAAKNATESNQENDKSAKNYQWTWNNGEDNDDDYDGFALEGGWEATFKDDAVKIILFERKVAPYSYRNSMNTRIPYGDLQGIDAKTAKNANGALSFRYERESGAFLFSGASANGKAEGSYRFEPSKEYAARVQQLGFGEPRAQDLASIAALKISFDKIQSYQGVKAPVRRIVEFALVGVKADYAREAQQAGLSPKEILEFGVLGIKPAYIVEMKRQGYSTQEVQELGVLGIKREYVDELKSLGVRTEEIKEFGALGIKASTVKSYKEAGIPAEDAKEYGVLGIRPDYVKEMRALGFSSEEIRELGVLGAKPARAQEYKKAGLPLDEIKEYVALGVKPETVLEYKNAGVPAREIKEYGVLGIRLPFIQEMKALGFGVDDVKEIGVLGIKPSTVKAYQAAGLDAKDVKSLAILGVKAEYVKELRALGFTSNQIGKISVMGARVSTVQKLKTDGLSNQRIVEILTERWQD